MISSGMTCEYLTLYSVWQVIDIYFPVQSWVSRRGYINNMHRMMPPGFLHKFYLWPRFNVKFHGGKFDTQILRCGSRRPWIGYDFPASLLGSSLTGPLVSNVFVGLRYGRRDRRGVSDHIQEM